MQSEENSSTSLHAEPGSIMLRAPIHLHPNRTPLSDERLNSISKSVLKYTLMTGLRLEDVRHELAQCLPMLPEHKWSLYCHHKYHMNITTSPYHQTRVISEPGQVDSGPNSSQVRPHSKLLPPPGQSIGTGSAIHPDMTSRGAVSARQHPHWLAGEQESGGQSQGAVMRAQTVQRPETTYFRTGTQHTAPNPNKMPGVGPDQPNTVKSYGILKPNGAMVAPNAVGPNIHLQIAENGRVHLVEPHSQTSHSISDRDRQVERHLSGRTTYAPSQLPSTRSNYMPSNHKSQQHHYNHAESTTHSASGRYFSEHPHSSFPRINDQQYEQWLLSRARTSDHGMQINPTDQNPVHFNRQPFPPSIPNSIAQPQVPRDGANNWSHGELSVPTPNTESSLSSTLQLQGQKRGLLHNSTLAQQSASGKAQNSSKAKSAKPKSHNSRSILARAVLLAAGKIPNNRLNAPWEPYRRHLAKDIRLTNLDYLDRPVPGALVKRNALIINPYIAYAINAPRERSQLSEPQRALTTEPFAHLLSGRADTRLTANGPTENRAPAGERQSVVVNHTGQSPHAATQMSPPKTLPVANKIEKSQKSGSSAVHLRNPAASSRSVESMEGLSARVMPATSIAKNALHLYALPNSGVQIATISNDCKRDVAVKQKLVNVRQAANEEHLIPGSDVAAKASLPDSSKIFTAYAFTVEIASKKIDPIFHYNPDEAGEIRRIDEAREMEIHRLDPYRSDVEVDETEALSEHLEEYPVYACGFHNCHAELHSFDTLVAHCDRVHGTPDVNGHFRCTWGSCLENNTYFVNFMRWQIHVQDDHQESIRNVCTHQGCKQAFPYPDDLLLHLDAVHAQSPYKSPSKKRKRLSKRELFAKRLHLDGSVIPLSEIITISDDETRDSKNSDDDIDLLAEVPSERVRRGSSRALFTRLPNTIHDAVDTSEDAWSSEAIKLSATDNISGWAETRDLLDGITLGSRRNAKRMVRKVVVPASMEPENVSEIPVAAAEEKGEFAGPILNDAAQKKWYTVL